MHNRGAVPLGDPTYIERVFERDVRDIVMSRRWVLLLGPRQHGKTSALIRLKTSLEQAAFLCAYVDLQRSPPLGSFRDLLQWWAYRVADSAGLMRPAELAGLDALDMGAWLSALHLPGKAPLVVIVDEAAAIADWDMRNAFFGQLRSLQNAAATAELDDPVKRLVVVFSGAFRPEAVVARENSPLNVCERVYTDDLSHPMADALFRSIVGTDANQEWPGLAYELVGGQPYLLQTAFGNLAEVLAVQEEVVPDRDFVRGLLEEVTSGRDGHLDGVFGPILAEEGTSGTISKLLAQEPVPNEPANADFLYLQVLGAVMVESNQLRFRNSLYAEFAAISPQIDVHAAESPTRAVPLALLPLTRSAFDFVADVDLAEFGYRSYLGAARSYTEGSFRLSLIGFGMCLEAVLIHALEALSEPDLAAAVAAGVAESDPSWRVSFSSYEDAESPRKYRLVTMLRVARKVSHLARHAGFSDVVREWRNLVHPANSLGAADEGALEPEARQASGILSALIRDLQPPPPI